MCALPIYFYMFTDFIIALYSLTYIPKPYLPDGPVTSVFRERENQPLNAEPSRNELADQFLREIEEARERDAVRQWWRHLDQAKSPQQELEVDPQDSELYEQKKRMRVPPTIF